MASNVDKCPFMSINSRTMEIGVKQVAELLNVSDKTIYRWVALDQIPFYRVGAQYRFSRSELLRWVAVKSPVAEEPADPICDTAPILLEQSLRAGGVFYRVGGVDVRNVLSEMLSLMRLPPGADYDHILDLVRGRELVATTAVGEGIAFPHCRDAILSELSSPMVALGFLENPVDFFAIDKQPVSVVFLFLSPSAQASIRLMSKLAYAVKQPVFSSLLQGVAARDEIYSALTAMDRELGE